MPLQLIQDSPRYNAACFEQREKPLDYRLLPLVTFFPMAHVRSVCRMCGNEAIVIPWQDYKGIIRFGEPDLCYSCDHVMSDYGLIDGDEDWEDEDAWETWTDNYDPNYDIDEDFEDEGYEASRDAEE